MTVTGPSATLELLHDPVHFLPRLYDELLQKVSPSGEVKVDGAAGDLPEGQSGVYGRDVPSIKQFRLS